MDVELGRHGAVDRAINASLTLRACMLAAAVAAAPAGMYPNGARWTHALDHLDSLWQPFESVVWQPLVLFDWLYGKVLPPIISICNPDVAPFGS